MSPERQRAARAIRLVLTGRRRVWVAVRRIAPARRRTYVVAALFAALAASGLVYLRLAPRVRLVRRIPTLLLQDDRGRFLAESSPNDRYQGFWPLPKAIPTKVRLATLAAEDARFESHPGVDLRSVFRAVVQDVRARHVVSGASTIAMQVARLQHPASRTLEHKIAEALVALALVHRYGHEAVLRQYLTIAPYGSRARGIVFAARTDLGKPIEDLTWAEAALLAGLPKIPGHLDIHQPDGWARAMRRGRYVLARLRALGWITDRRYDEALRALPRLTLAPAELRPVSTLHAVLEMAAQARNEKRRAPIVHTTLDLSIQEKVSDIAARSVKRFHDLGAGNLAVVVADAKTGAVRAYLGSADYLDRDHKGAIDYARVARSPGSALKPFVYGLGMSLRGLTAATVLGDIGLAPDPATGSYVARNYDGRYLGPVLYRNALANSRNVPAVEVLEQVGVGNAYRLFHRLGLAHGWRDPASYGLGMVLGSMPVRLVDLVRAYGVLASGGRTFDLHWFAGAPPAKSEQLVPEPIARELAIFLSDPMARLPSFRRGDALEMPLPVAVKTGTSSGFRDAWCVGFSARYVVGVWVGDPDDRPMNHVSGSSSAAVVLHKVFAALEPDEMQGLSNTGFPPPRGWVQRRIDMLTGKLARADTPYVATEWFAPGTEPVMRTDAYRDVVIDRRTGRPATPRCPRRDRRRRTFVALDPRFAGWAKAAGLELPPLPDLATDPAMIGKSPTLAVASPRAGSHLMPDPEMPAGDSTVRLTATVSPPVPQVVWYVDGKPFRVVDYPYETQWPLEPGRHVFQVRLPYAPVRSRRVAVRVDD